jgi:Tfp pilus assembly protein PilE
MTNTTRIREKEGDMMLIRALIVIVVLGVLAVIIVPQFREARNEALRLQLAAADANSVVESNSVEPNGPGDPRELVDMPVP